ncbi:MAG TPA: ABC transporter permease, partial [Puia sp.]
MFKYYLKLIGRRLVRDRQFTALNLLGLSTGLACVILIYSWASSELSIDRFHANSGRLYQVMAHIKLPDGIHTQNYGPALMAPALVKDMPEIQATLRVNPAYDLLTVGENKFNVPAEFVDQNFFQVLSYRLLEGDKNQPFPDQHSVLISDQLAMRCFHTTQGLTGKTIKWGNDSIPFAISGVFAHPGGNSSAQFDLLFNFELKLVYNPDLKDWGNSNPDTYIVLQPGADVDGLQKKLKGYLQTKASYSPLSLSLRKYGDKYLYDTYENGVAAGGRIGYVHLFSLTAIFILSIACINFMNLSTAKAARRAKELGVKKVAGARKGQLIVQYLGESVMMAFLALTIALGLVLILLPGFNAIAGKQLGLQANVGFWGAVFGITLLTGLLAGSYPALYLSGFKPAQVLKGKLPHSPAELFVRKGLVVFQFVLSMIFIVSVLVIYRQIRYLQTTNLGYSREHVVTFDNSKELASHFRPFVNDLRHIPGVTGVASADANMTGAVSGNTEKVDWEGKQPGQGQLFWSIDMDYNLFDLLDIRMAEGRSFSRQYPSDSASAVLLNEAAVKAIGMKHPLGKYFRVWGGDFRIVGVVKDFHFKSLYEQIKPCFFRFHPVGSTFFVKIDAGHEQAALTSLTKLHEAYAPGVPFDYHFIDQAYEALYTAEQHISVLSRYIAGLAVLISCLGLFGLAAFTAQKRQKEIG